MNKKKNIILTSAVVAVAAIVIVSWVVLSRKTYTVTFYSDSKSVMKVDMVKRGSLAEPPNEPSITEGRIFTKWNKELSNVRKNMDVFPECEDTAGKDNVIAMNGAYGKKDEEVFIRLSLCGNVCLSGVDLTLTYDADSLEFVSVFDDDGAVVYNADEKGTIRLNYISVENTEDSVDLCGLKFKVKADKGSTQIKTTVEKIVAWNDANKLIEPKFTLIDPTVFVL